ncbi:IclR family transcriptional regulator [Pseudalkalibacillus decolorationis]|uniref:IclR family transcriptional regulator n=1 Tax=Pseudalkalibacillus decolorationis TaxID=163879 RepID=UPI0021486EE4|nr:IclR family transcriptional regulator [Pseudalkalibacillus decolorationis]
MAVQSVDRALSIIEVLGNHPNGLGVINLSKTLNLPKSTIHRLLNSLITRNFVYQNEENERYYLGMKLAQISSKIIENLDIRVLARPYIEDLSQITNEVVHLCIRDGNEVAYIDKVESNRTIRMYSQIGKRAMLHCTGVGKVLISGLPDHKIIDIVDQVGLPKFTENTITSKEAFIQEIQLIRQNGYALDQEEHEDGIYCIAAPIYDYSGNIIAGFSLSGPINRIKSSIENGHYKSYLLSTAYQISERLGYIKES